MLSRLGSMALAGIEATGCEAEVNVVSRGFANAAIMGRPNAVAKRRIMWPQLRARACIICVSLFVLQISARGAETVGDLRAGAAAVDITPQVLPVRVSGSFYERTTSDVMDRLHARCLVLDDGRGRIAVAVIDNCVIPRDLFDEAKQLAGRLTGIPEDRMLMSATHTHSGPALDGILGCEGNPQYRQWLPQRIAEAVQVAVANLGPARIGWTVVQAPEYTHCRQWIRRPDRIDVDPFGNRTVRSMMHPGYQNPDYLGPAGPSDPDLFVVAVQSVQGQPIALLANYSMHYFGAPPLSADYFGAFADKAAELLGGGHPPCIAMMSNGTSGDQHWMDYGRPKPERPKTHQEYAEALARRAVEACRGIEYHDRVPLTACEKRLVLKVRPISDEDQEKARELAATFEGRQPKTLPEVYAAQQVQLSKMPAEHELKLQALGIAELGIAAIPCEVFGLTGLKIKAYSPLKSTFTIELANGYDGYLPPPAQHPLGGYTTWRARSACLEVQAEPRIVESAIGLLEQVAGRPRRTVTGADYPLAGYPQAVLASQPIAYWRMDEFEGPRATDAGGKGHHGTFESGVVFYLEGPGEPDARDLKRMNRAPHFAGGRMIADLDGLSDKYTIEMWFNNYLPADAREMTGYLFSIRAEGGHPASGDHLGIGGTIALDVGSKVAAQGRLLFHRGNGGLQVLTGRTEIRPKTWNHLALVRDGRKVAVYLNGSAAEEISGQAGLPAPGPKRVFIGGRDDGHAGFEGRIDEVAVYDRPLAAGEIAGHLRAAVGEKSSGG